MARWLPLRLLQRAALLVVVAATSVLFLTGQISSPAPVPLVLKDVPPDLLAQDGLFIYGADPGASPNFSEDAARQEAGRRFGETAVARQVVLARVVELSVIPLGIDIAADDIAPGFDQVVWVVNYDPTTTGVSWHGWQGKGPPPDQPPRYHLMFLDANTGEFLFSVSH